MLVLVLVVVMVNLGFWQLDRLDQRRDRNDLIRERQDQPAVAVEELLAPDDGPDAVDEVRFRGVFATGTYDEDETVVVRNRTQDGTPGAWVLTPLVLETGDEVGVVRGFTGLRSDGDVDVPPAPGEEPDGEVTVTGAVVSPAGLDGTASSDVAPLLDRGGTLPVLVMAESSEPPEEALGTTLHPVPLPDLEEGPHLSYAVQWFIFSAIAAVGYPLVLRRVVQRRGHGDEIPEQEVKARSNGEKSQLDRELEEILRSGPSGG